jgi:putative ABC transport system permease protein
MSERRYRYFEPIRRNVRKDVDDEIRFHLEARIADLTERGIPLDEAKRRAEAEFGDAAQVRAETLVIDERMHRRSKRIEWLDELWRDMRVAMRSLRKSPAFAVTAVLCAALGIGITAAVTSASYSILVRPLPFPKADQLVMIYGENTVKGYTGSNISYPDYVSWRDGTRTFSSIGMWTWNTVTMSGMGDAERYSGGEVTANLFPLLGVNPMLGRHFSAGEETPGRNYVALISERLWRARFGADSAIVGKEVRLDGRPHVVVGVMPPRFNFPDRGDVWVPFSTNVANEGHGNRGYAGAIGRMRGGITIEAARADLHTIDARLQREFPEENHGWRAELTSLRDDLVGDLRQPLKVFMWAVTLVLLMVCANVANLMLARGAAREREMAVRTALGASRGRLSRQLMTESLAVALLGGALGVAIAWFGVRLLRYGFPRQVPPFFINLELDGIALSFIGGITLLTGLLFGLAPAMRGARTQPLESLRDGAHGATGSLHRSRLRRVLVVGQISLSVVLLVGAGLLGQSYRNLAGSDLGFDDSNVLTASLTLPPTEYPGRERTRTFYAALQARLRALPGVTLVASGQGIPFSGWDVQTQARVEGTPPPKRGEELTSHFQYVTPDFFKALGVGLVRGRWFTDSDRDSLNPTVLVNEQMVLKGFNGADPIGKRVLLYTGGPEVYATVVGVVRDYRHYRLPQPMGPAVYYPFATLPRRQQTVVVRTSGDASALAGALREAVKELDPSVAAYQVETLEEVVARSLWRQRLQGNVLAIFAALSLLLSCIGLYGVVAYAVAQRTRELGVRMALGATRKHVAWLVMGQGARLVVSGVAIGLAAAWFASRVLESLLFGVAARDLATLAVAPLCLGAVALAATAIPARRATRVDPIVAMRAE